MWQRVPFIGAVDGGLVRADGAYGVSGGDRSVTVRVMMTKPAIAPASRSCPRWDPFLSS